MKKILLVVSMVMVIFFTCAAPAVFADAIAYDIDDAGYYVYVKTPDGGLNMRNGPGTDYNIISSKRIPDGTRLYIDFKSDNWGYTKYNGIEGWVALKQTTKTPPATPTPTKKPTPSPEPVKETAEYYVYVSAPDGKLNLRTGPGTDYNTVDDYSIPNNTFLYIEEVVGTWGYVTFDGREGWVALKQTTKADPPTTTAPSQEELTPLEDEEAEEQEEPANEQEESKSKDSEEEKAGNSSLIRQICLIAVLLLMIVAASLSIVIIINSKKKQQ